MIEVKNLTRKYGEKTAIEDVSFQIGKGEIVGLLGSNGAGKTTIMKIIAGHLMPTNGSVLVDGVDVVEQPREAAAKIGFLPEIPPLYPDMEVREYLRFLAEIRGIEKGEREARIEEVLQAAKITHVQDRVIGNLSKGYRQRTGLAGALIGMPEILILDEPTVGLDPRQITEFRNLMIELGKKHTIIFSTHILSEIDMVCEKVIIISDGHVAAVDTMENLERSKISQNEIIVLVAAEREAAQNVLTGVVQGVEFCEQTAEGVRFRVTTLDALQTKKDIFAALAGAQMPLLEMKNAARTLEQVFLHLTSTGEEQEK